ncbi:hypothetical protein M758_12G001400 [Ceratodon purpureus]|nr:hypothetical protein M758_12G001400 [Ceratodon purpureus]
MGAIPYHLSLLTVKTCGWELVSVRKLLRTLIVPKPVLKPVLKPVPKPSRTLLVPNSGWELTAPLVQTPLVKTQLETRRIFSILNQGPDPPNSDFAFIYQHHQAHLSAQPQ